MTTHQVQGSLDNALISLFVVVMFEVIVISIYHWCLQACMAAFIKPLYQYSAEDKEPGSKPLWEWKKWSHSKTKESKTTLCSLRVIIQYLSTSVCRKGSLLVQVSDAESKCVSDDFIKIKVGEQRRSMFCLAAGIGIKWPFQFKSNPGFSVNCWLHMDGPILSLCKLLYLYCECLL